MLDYTSDYLRQKRRKRKRIAGKGAISQVVEGEKRDVRHHIKNKERATVTGRIAC